MPHPRHQVLKSRTAVRRELATGGPQVMNVTAAQLGAAAALAAVEADDGRKPENPRGLRTLPCSLRKRTPLSEPVKAAPVASLARRERRPPALGGPGRRTPGHMRRQADQGGSHWRAISVPLTLGRCGTSHGGFVCEFGPRLFVSSDRTMVVFASFDWASPRNVDTSP